MNKNTKQAVDETNRWLRVTVLTLTMLAPVISTIAGRLEKRAEMMREEARKQSVVSDLVERGSKTTQAIADRGSVMLGDLAGRREKMSKEVARRSKKVSQEVAQRSEKASREIAERSEKINREIARRSEKINREIARRSERASKELARRSQEVANVLAERSREASARLPERNGTFWTIFGFTIGLTATAVTVFWFIRRRLLGDTLESQSFQITQNGI